MRFKLRSFMILGLILVTSLVGRLKTWVRVPTNRRLLESLRPHLSS